ncbi:MAG: LL-diaminopimelate aminotransferase [bacterium]|nr:LL-diaminopimelate aminotransferase [bacterium]
MVNIRIEKAERLKKLPVYLFAELDNLKTEAKKKGIDIIDLGVGSPDLPAPSNIIKRAQDEIADKNNHGYPSYIGMIEFRKATASWYKERFNVNLDPETEILALIGSKEGIGHIPLAFINEGDVVLVPDPGYPVYQAGTVFAGGVPYFMPLLRENNFFPDFKKIDPKVLKKAKLMFINYPNNPTTAVANKEFFEEVVAFASKNNIIVCHDAAYSEIYYDKKIISFLEVDGAKDVGIEFHSFSKTYNMAGWRIGFAAGNKDILSGLGQIKTNLDSGIFQAVQLAAVEALRSPKQIKKEIVNVYQERRNLFVNGLKKLKWDVIYPEATFYVWVAVPKGLTSRELTTALIKECGIVATPGAGFGSAGEGYIRFSLTTEKKRLQEALDRIGKLKI